MAKRGGFPGMGMPGNMNNLMKQAQKMQRQMEENQKALDDIEMLEDLIVAATNEALRKVEEESAAVMSKLTGGLGSLGGGLLF